MQKKLGFQWKSSISIANIPLIHIAIGFNKQTGKLMIAKGIIAIGIFSIGVFSISIIGIGILIGIGQLSFGGLLSISQISFSYYFSLGQIAISNNVSIGQLAFGKYVLAQIGFGKYVWSKKRKDPIAIEYFKNLWEKVIKILKIKLQKKIR